VWGGRALVVGFAGGEIEKVALLRSRSKTRPSSVSLRQLPLNLVLLKNASVIGIYWGSYQSMSSFFLNGFTVTPFPENKLTRVSEVWTELLALFASGRLKPVVFNGRYTLGTLAQGLQDLENRKTWGKVVVHVRESSARGKL
jgi:NADPH2:quinone reductase